MDQHACGTLLSLPVVTTIHGRFRREGLLKNIYNKIMLRGDRVIAISNHIYQQVVDVNPQAQDKMTIIHRGVDIDVFSPDKVTPQRVIRMSDQLAAPDDVPIIMLPARPSKWKGAHVLVEAAARITDEEFIVLLVGALDGNADFQKELIGVIEKLNMTSRVRLCSTVDDMAAALMLADVVAMPSLTPEPFGRVAIEASHGMPVVAFNHGGARRALLMVSQAGLPALLMSVIWPPASRRLAAENGGTKKLVMKPANLLKESLPPDGCVTIRCRFILIAQMISFPCRNAVNTLKTVLPDYPCR